jgi:hypothetical protein
VNDNWRNSYDAWKLACPYPDWEEEPDASAEDESDEIAEQWDAWEVELGWQLDWEREIAP